MWESLVCILRHSLKDKKRIHEKRVREISGEKGFKNQGFHAFRFEASIDISHLSKASYCLVLLIFFWLYLQDYDFTVDFVTSRFLVRESSFEGKNGSLETLRLDLMDQSTSMYSNADYLIFNTGHWWSHDKTSKRLMHFLHLQFIFLSLFVNYQPYYYVPVYHTPENLKSESI